MARLSWDTVQWIRANLAVSHHWGPAREKAKK